MTVRSLTDSTTCTRSARVVPGRLMVAALFAAVASGGLSLAALGERDDRVEASTLDGKVICYSGEVLGQPTGDICVPYPLG